MLDFQPESPQKVSMVGRRLENLILQPLGGDMDTVSGCDPLGANVDCELGWITWRLRPHNNHLSLEILAEFRSTHQPLVLENSCGDYGHTTTT